VPARDSGNDLMQYDKPDSERTGGPVSRSRSRCTNRQLEGAMGTQLGAVNAADVTAVAPGHEPGLRNDYLATGDKRVLAHTIRHGGGRGPPA